MGRRRITKDSSKSKKPRVLGRGDARMKKWNTIADIPLDNEEQFHANRDKILLNGEDAYEDEDDVDEVFALKGLDDDDEEDEEEEGEEEEEAYEEDGDEVVEKTKGSASKSKKKPKAPSTSEEDGDDSQGEMEESWGKGRGAYYSSNAGQIDSDDEEANMLEEQEALKIQAKARDTLNDEDFGFGVTIEHSEKPSADELVPAELLTEIPQDAKSLLRQLEKTSPETIALAHDWEDTASNLIRTKQAIEASQGMDARRLGEIHLHYQTLLTYATTLAFYFYLRTGPKYSQKPELLQSHPIMSQLLTLKNALSQLELAEFPIWASTDSLDEDEDEDLMLDAEELWKLAAAKGLDKDELENLLREANITINPPKDDLRAEKGPKEKKKEKKEVTTVQPIAPPKKKRKTDNEAASNLPVFDLVEPEFISSTSISTEAPQTTDDGYGELSALDHADTIDKKTRRKSLRFHTSKIESASTRRQGARNTAFGGDDDIPYKERKHERDARLAREAAARGAGQGGDDLDDVDPELPTTKKRPREEDEDGGVDDYYDLIKNQKSKKKAQKKAEYEAERAAARLDLEEDNTDGPRSLTRAILKNKGLTPHRPKSVRNPRVKKREKFEKAKKKVASQKAVYRGGVGASGKYEGERTGITKVAKGIKLS